MRCNTCGAPLWFAYFLMGMPFTKRVKKYKDARDCVDLLTLKTSQEIRRGMSKTKKGGYL